MKTVTIVTLGLLLALFGAWRLQATENDRTMTNDGGMAPSIAPQAEHKEMMHDTMKGAQRMIASDAELRLRLTPLQYKVTREEGTEPPFNNAYWDNHTEGLYVDIISGVPLFSSTDKYDSGTGWPSFIRPLDPAAIVTREDRSFFTLRTEVRARLSDAHLGHVFNDGPPPTGLRYCMNSAALRFVPKDELAKEGYGDYAKLFK